MPEASIIIIKTRLRRKSKNSWDNTVRIVVFISISPTEQKIYIPGSPCRR